MKDRLAFPNGLTKDERPTRSVFGHSRYLKEHLPLRTLNRRLRSKAGKRLLPDLLLLSVKTRTFVMRCLDPEPQSMGPLAYYESPEASTDDWMAPRDLCIGPETPQFVAPLFVRNLHCLSFARNWLDRTVRRDRLAFQCLRSFSRSHRSGYISGQ